MSEERSPDELARLSERIDRARRAETPVVRDSGAGQQQALAVGFRIGIEFVVAIIVATGLGWAFDRVLGTRPFGMIVMFFLGVATAMLNVYRAITGQSRAVGFGPPRRDVDGKK
jgi:ATP synthase protein I